MIKINQGPSENKFKWLKNYSAIYIAAFALLIGIVFLSYYRINNTVYTQTNQYNGIVLSQLKSQMDNSMDKVTNLAYQLSVSKIVNQVSLYDMPMSSTQRAKLTSLAICVAAAVASRLCLLIMSSNTLSSLP